MKIDLVTGFLGSGKTTFIEQYAKYLISKGEKICILENDFGAINVDLMLLENALGDICDTEMVVGGGDPDCHRRRLKTKLIAMGMDGYDRVIMEPSGVFDVDEFFDLLYEEPLDRWYQVGNVIAVVDMRMPNELARISEYILTSETACAGKIVLTRADSFPTEEEKQNRVQEILAHLNRESENYRGSRRFNAKNFIPVEAGKLTQEQLERISKASYVRSDLMKLDVAEDGSYQTVFYYKVSKTPDEIRQITAQLFADPGKYGQILRIKGFFHEPGSENWMELNAVKEDTEITPAPVGQEVIIVIGIRPKTDAIGAAFGETRNVLDYEI